MQRLVLEAPVGGDPVEVVLGLLGLTARGLDRRIEWADVRILRAGSVLIVHVSTIRSRASDPATSRGLPAGATLEHQRR